MSSERPGTGASGPESPLVLARELVREARIAMGIPSTAAMERCAFLLRDAEQQLRRFVGEASWKAGPSGHATEAAGLRCEFLELRALVENCGAFHLGWARLRACLSGGYTSRGTASDLMAENQLSVTG